MSGSALIERMVFISALRISARGLRQRGTGIFFLLTQHLSLSARSAPRERAGLLSSVPAGLDFLGDWCVNVPSASDLFPRFLRASGAWRRHMLNAECYFRLIVANHAGAPCSSWNLVCSRSAWIDATCHPLSRLNAARTTS